MSKSQAFEVNFLPSRQSCVAVVKNPGDGVAAQGLRVGKAGNLALPTKRQNENQPRLLPLLGQSGQANRRSPIRASLKLQVAP